MPKLSWKTKGDSNPQGKPRVYFCCHHDDFDRFFDEVSDEILKKHNCAIYYDSEPMGETNEEEWLSYLGEMQLFVMPVTTRLLTSENKALNLEFQFAEEKHIPVLPLMQENGLDELFSEKVGSLQYLNKHKTDSSAISYEKKLHGYLDSVLVGDELAAKVRAAFDAYIFLSYRKKDRVYAQELMRLIHKNEFCRDIAIWYDEFLTPGENFNEAIEEALNKSELFTLAVTPNLVNEENYVMNVEYPMAKKAGKTILPAEVVSTDRNELKEKYKDIPLCANAHDETELSQALLNSLKSIALRENDTDPKHNFFIGLAYLSGIDVEVNHERAVELITSAAQAGLIEAMEKLVAMYRSGDGVERNYETAIEWQEKLVKYWKRRWEKHHFDIDAYRLCLELMHLGDYCYEIFKCGKAIEAYSELYDLSEIIYNTFDDCRQDALNFMAAANNNLGNAYRSTGNIELAGQLYEKAVSVLEETVSANGSFEEKCDLCAGYANLAYILFTQNENHKAKPICSKAIDLALDLTTQKNDITALNLLSLSYNTLGDGLFKENRLDEAEEAYLKAVKSDKNAVELFPCSKTKNMLCISLNNLGENYKIKCDFSKAEKYHLKALDILTEIYNEDPSVATRISICNTQKKLSEIYAMENDYHSAERWALNTLKIQKELISETEIAAMATAAASSYCDLGDIYIFQNRPDKASQMYNEALKILEHSDNNNLTMASIYNKLGDLYINTGKIAAAKTFCQNAVEITEAIAKNRNNFRAKNHLIVSYVTMAKIYEAEGDLTESQTMFEKAFAVSESMGNQVINGEVQFFRAVVCHNLGYMFFIQDNFSQSEKMYMKAIDILKNLIYKTNNQLHKRLYSECYLKLALICLSKDDYEKTESLAKTASDLFENLYAESRYIEDKFSIFRSLLILSEGYFYSDENSKAKMTLEKAFTLKSEIPEDYEYSVADRMSFLSAQLHYGVLNNDRSMLKSTLKDAKQLNNLMPNNMQVKEIIKICKRTLRLNRIPLVHNLLFGLYGEEE